jgi:hypothetical protein
VARCVTGTFDEFRVARCALRVDFASRWLLHETVESCSSVPCTSLMPR